MKIIALFGAAALAVASLTAAPAQAQRGWDNGSRHGWNDGPRHDWNNGPRRGPGWDRGGPRGYRQHYRGPRGGYYNRGGYNRGGYNRSRVVCRVQRGYYGPVRRCFRVYR